MAGSSATDSLGNWGVSESTICRIVTNIESTLMKTGKFGMTGKKAWFKGFGHQQSCGNGGHRNTYRTPKKNRKNTLHSIKNTTA